MLTHFPQFGVVSFLRGAFDMLQLDLGGLISTSVQAILYGQLNQLLRSMPRRDAYSASRLLHSHVHVDVMDPLEEP